MAHVDYYFSTLSPFAYLAGERLEEIAARHGATIRYKPLDIIALFARTGGTPPAERHPSRQQYRRQELERQARKHGLPLNPQPRHWPTNPAPSSYVIITAQEEGVADVGRLVHAILRASWAEERDIADEAVLREILEGQDLDPEIVNRGLMTAAEIYARNLEDAVAAGVFGSPFYVVDSGQRFWGQDRLEDLDAHLAGRL